MSKETFVISLHAGQREVFNNKARFQVVVAGRRWGKTQLSKAKIIREARRPKKLIWYIAPTYRMAKQIMWEDLLNSLPRRWVVRTNETAMTIWLVNGTRIELKGADNPDTLRGVGLDYVVLDEFQDMSEETWIKVIRPTLASTGGRALFIGTPKSYNHLYTLYKLGQRAEYRSIGAWCSWQFPTITSPFIPKAEIEAAKADMDEKSFKQEFEASFEVMSGRVYHAFNRKEHVGKYEFNPKLPIWIGQDFNIDPMSSVIMQPQPDGEIWIVDELVLFGSNSQETAEDLEKKYYKYEKQTTLYPDPAGGNRSHTRGESDLDVFREKGFKRIKYRRKHPLVADRINAVNRMLKAADGTIRIRVNENCKHIINSLEQTIYKEGCREVDKSIGVEHSADALGYCIEFEFPTRKYEAIGASI